MVLPTDPAAPFFPAGYGPVPSDFNGWVQSPLSFLTSKVVFRAELTNALTWSTNLVTVIPFNSILEDPYAGWSGGGSTWTCPAGCSGTYLVSMTVSSTASADTATSLRAVLFLNGNNLWTVAEGQTSSSQNNQTSGAVPVQLYGGQDALTFYGFLASAGGASAVTTAGQRCTAEVTWISL